MATKKPPAGPERVHSKSFNGAKRGTVLRRFTAPTPDSYFGADFALVEFDHHPTPIWSSTKFLAKPVKRDLYERWRADPVAALGALAKGSTEDVLRACARISGGQRTHHDGTARWVGLVRHLPLALGTECLVGLLERLRSDPAMKAFDEPAALDGSEYNRSDFKYGPRVRGGDLDFAIQYGLTRYWRHAVGDQPTTIVEALAPPLRERAVKIFAGQYEDGREHLRARLTRPTFAEAFQGVTREYNARVGLDDEFAMVQGTGY